MGELRGVPERDAPALARIDAALAVARRIADPSDPLGREARRRLVALEELSSPGIELALREHLEVDARRDDLAALLARARREGAPPSKVAVILSANVCTAALRAVAFALAAAPLVQVKPSRRDPVLAELLAGELPSLALVRTAEAALEELAPGDEVHLYGSDDTLAALTPRARDLGLVARGHGAGFGVALVDSGDDLDVAAAALARDLVPFDGRGCLSPRLVLVSGGADRSLSFATRLDAALSRFAAAVPRGPLDEAARAELAGFARTYAIVGDVRPSPDHLIVVDPAPESLVPAPAHRAIALAAVPAERLAGLLAPWAPAITVVGAGARGALSDAVAALVPRARQVALGRMQRPPLDGPVDLRLL